MEIFDDLPETYSDKDLKLKLTQFYLDWIHRMDFKQQEFSQDQLSPVQNKNNKVLAKVGIAEIAVWSLKCEFRFGTVFYFVIDQTSKIWLYREHDHRVLVASIKDLNHLMELLNDPILMED